MKILYSMILCTVVFMASCDKNRADDDMIVLKYAQTACADQWGNSQAGDAVLLQQMGQFLDTRGLFHTGEAIIQENFGQTCNACVCLTGKIYYLRTNKNQEQAYNALNFYR